MSFELTVAYDSQPDDLKAKWEEELKKLGIIVEICPDFDSSNWQGGFLPMKLVKLPEQYHFGLTEVIQVSGFEVDFTDVSAHFRTSMGRTIAELILQCTCAGTLAVITGGTYFDPQTGNSFEGSEAIARAHQEILDHEPYLDNYSKTQHTFSDWSDYM